MSRYPVMAAPASRSTSRRRPAIALRTIEGRTSAFGSEGGRSNRPVRMIASRRIALPHRSASRSDSVLRSRSKGLRCRGSSGRGAGRPSVDPPTVERRTSPTRSRRSREKTPLSQCWVEGRRSTAQVFRTPRATCAPFGSSYRADRPPPSPPSRPVSRSCSHGPLTPRILGVLPGVLSWGQIGHLEGPNFSSHAKVQSPPEQAKSRERSGGRGIRTPVGLSPQAVFKTAAIGRSAIPPREDSIRNVQFSTQAQGGRFAGRSRMARPEIWIPPRTST